MQTTDSYYQGKMIAPKGVLLDYGGTLDSNGNHWVHVLYKVYKQVELYVDEETFRKAYIYAEQMLETGKYIAPNDSFIVTLYKKITLQIEYLTAHGCSTHYQSYTNSLALHAYCEAQRAIERIRPTLVRLCQALPVVIVSNFYGNLSTVLYEFDLRELFAGVVESRKMGIRKPNLELFKYGIDMLQLEPDQIVMIGDSYKNDIAPAIELGCHTIWLKQQGWSSKEITNKSEHIFTDFVSIFDIIKL